METRYLNRGGRDGWGYVPWNVSHVSSSVVTAADLGLDFRQTDQVVPIAPAAAVIDEHLPAYEDLFGAGGAAAVVDTSTGELVVFHFLLEEGAEPIQKRDAVFLFPHSPSSFRSSHFF